MGYMIGEKVILREYCIEDLPYARAWANDTAITDMLSHTFLRPQTWDMTENYFRSIISGQASGYHFVIAEKQGQEYLGQIDLFSLQEVDRHAELGIVLGAEKDRGRGVGREAIGLLLAFAFEKANLNRIHLTVCAENERAIRCYEACGFQREGLLRQHLYQNGSYRDIVTMGILREDWKGATHVF